MKCSGFPTEQYDLFAIGTLEAEDGLPLSEHIKQDCETCLHELKRSLAFWALFGSTFSPDANPQRSIAISPKLVALIPRHGVKSHALSWYQWGAIAATVAIVTAAGTWLVARRSTPPPPPQQTQTAAPVNETLQREVAELTRQRDAARTQESEANNNSATLQRSVDQRQRELTVVGSTVAELRSQSEQAQRDAQDARTRATQLQSQLTSQREQLTAALREQQQAEVRLADVTESQRKADEQVRTLTAQVRQLTRERAELLFTIQTREQQSAQSLQMISLLALPSTKLVHVNGTEAAPEARGYALVTAENHVVFYGSGLPALAAGREYQLWLLRAKSPAVVSAGVFRAGPNQPGHVDFANAQLTSAITAIAVTEEPEGGSPRPTGHKVLAGLVGRS